MEQELDVLTVPCVKVSLNSGFIHVTPIKVKELSAFTKAVLPMIGAFNEETDQGALIAALLINHIDSIIKAVAIGVRESEDFINELEIDELAELITAVIEVNTDFFIHKALPKINQGVERLGNKFNQAGPSSTSSSESMG